VATTDHFSSIAATYAEFRPSYPDGLFRWLAEVAPGRKHAWDCATGNGQAAVSLAEHFDQVTATDIGAGMIAHAQPHPRVTYAVGTAEDAPVADQSVDLITVAQALHWFDRPRFWATCQRVLLPGGVLAYWGYLKPQITPEIDALVDRYHDEIVGPYWPPGREPLLDLYREVTPPGTRLKAPSFAMQTHWKLADLKGHLASWSATARYRAGQGKDPLDAIATPLNDAWRSTPTRIVSWPLGIHAFRFEATP